MGSAASMSSLSGLEDDRHLQAGRSDPERVRLDSLDRVDSTKRYLCFHLIWCFVGQYFVASFAISDNIVPLQRSTYTLSRPLLVLHTWLKA